MVKSEQMQIWFNVLEDAGVPLDARVVKRIIRNQFTKKGLILGSLTVTRKQDHYACTVVYMDPEPSGPSISGDYVDDHGEG